jgi:hypothetical protein
MTLHPNQKIDWLAEPIHVEILVVDEADWLKTLALEVLRDVHDRTRIGLVLIGMPGVEKRLTRYPQLYSRVAFVHQYRALSAEELRFILAHKWSELGLTFAPDDFTDAEALVAIGRITGRNFRLVQRLFSQIERVLEINQLQMISQEVVEAARESLIIVPTVSGRPPESAEDSPPYSGESHRCGSHPLASTFTCWTDCNTCTSFRNVGRRLTA